MGFFSKIKQGLQKTRDSIANGVNSVINSFTKIDEELFEELEETLVMSDIGVTTAGEICEKLRHKIKETGRAGNRKQPPHAGRLPSVW